MNDPDGDDISESNTVNTLVLNLAVVTAESALSITFESLRQNWISDNQYQQLLKKIKHGTFAETFTLEDAPIKEFYNVRHSLSIIDGIIMYSHEGSNLRIVIPKQIRHQIILNLHAANQGSTSMLARARQVLYWPGMDRDINNHMESCLGCRR